MGRPSKVRYREDRGAWVTVIDGKYRTLARGKRNRAEAMQAFHRLKGASISGAQEPNPIVVGEMVDRLLTWVRDNRAPLTLEWYRRFLESFVNHVGRETPCRALRDTDATGWLTGQAWGQSSSHGAITALRRLSRWGIKKGYLAADPFANLDKPPIRRRESILSPDDELRVIASARGALKPYLEFLRETGCRPSEGARIEAQHVDFAAGTITMSGKTTRRTRKPRVIYLTARAAEILRPLVETRPVGALFRNQRGNPWHRHALASTMGRLRRKLGIEHGCTCSSFRHGWVTDAKLVMPNSVVAELAGHTSTQMIDLHYGHINERASALSEAAAKVRSPDTDTSPSPVVSPSPDAPPVSAPPGKPASTDRSPRR